MNVKLTVIVDNVSDSSIKGEWGLSILAEYDDKKILIDAGASDLFAENMEKLGLDVKDIDHAVLSHAHYDHANGMPVFFQKNSDAKFYVRDSVRENCYVRDFILKKYIGIPKNVLREYHDRICFVSGDFELYKGVYLIPHKTASLDMIGKREKMYIRTERGWKYDDFSHEQSVVLDTDKGLVIINSCSHGGAVNIINEIKSTFPDKNIYGLIGGLHLYNKTTDEIEKTAKAIKDTGIEYICTGHCTGKRAYGIMKQHLGERLHQLKVGLELRF